MFGGLIKKIFGDKNTKLLKEFWPKVEIINSHFEKLNNITDEELKSKTDDFKNRIHEYTREERERLDEINNTLKDDNFDGDRQELVDERESIEKILDKKYQEILDEIMPEAFAVVKETCKRHVGKSWQAAEVKVNWEMIPYDVQLIGGMVLHSGRIAEMATGEGKTLVATLPIYLNALTGRGVHVVTVNDYLAKRDSEWMGPIFTFHGLTIGCILNTMDNDDRKEMYNRDITYGTNNEFGFDYLRDNMAISLEHLVQRRHNYAIVDEVDSVLIDEARTPLIISGAVGSTVDQKFNEMRPAIDRLVKKQTSLVASIVQQAEELLKTGDSKDKEKAGVLLFRAHRGLPKNKRLAKIFTEGEYKKLMLDTELDFLREKGKRLPEIDDELYFTIDEKSNQIDLMEMGREELARGSAEGPQYFVLPDLGSEISVIENNSQLVELDKVKKRDEVYKIYSERSDRIHTLNQLLKAYCLFEKDVEYVITDDGKVAIVDEFTGRVLPGRRYSDGLHQAIEAKENVKVERDTQTMATITLQNYFRLYKKIAGMTGTAETEEGEFGEIYKLEVVVIPTNRPITRDDQDDAVFKTKREKYNAVIEKIKELKENGVPVLVGTTSVEVSETISRMLKRQAVAHNVLNAKQNQREAEVVAFAGQPGAVTIATNMAGRGTDIKLGSGVKEKGGLYILGTERHESRRIDRQLRGRAGRQGDPGISKFYLSLEDDLMRLFGSDRISSVMSRMGLEEGEVIQHPLITKSVERAQKKVEENNFAIRKRLLEFDNVMNSQREVIYYRRKQALEGERLKAEVFDMLEEYVSELCEKYFDDGAIEEIKAELLQNLLIDIRIDEETFNNIKLNDFKEKVMESCREFYKRKEEMIGSDLMARLERYAYLSVIDEKWKEHLRDMDDLKEGIGLRAYGQKDPLIEYKGEGYKLFVALLDTIRNEIVSFCFKFFPSAPDEVKRKQAQNTRMRAIKEENTGMGMQGGEGQDSDSNVKQKPVRVDPKVGRNDPCPCGSGKKYKQCHGVEN